MNTRPEKTPEEQLAAYEAWYDEQVRLGLEDIEAGRVLSHEEVARKSEALLTHPTGLPSWPARQATHSQAVAPSSGQHIIMC